MAKGILRMPRAPRTKGILKPKTVHDHVMKNTTLAERHTWAHDYVKGFAAAQMLKRRMGGM